MISKGDFVTLRDFLVQEIRADKCMLVEQIGLQFWVAPGHVASYRPAQLINGDYVRWFGDLYQIVSVVGDKAWIEDGLDNSVVPLEDLTFVERPQ